MLPPPISLPLSVAIMLLSLAVYLINQLKEVNGKMTHKELLDRLEEIADSCSPNDEQQASISIALYKLHNDIDEEGVD